jgi:pantoate--beta-alanine ligase
MHVLATPAEVRAFGAAERQAGRTLALVPTMGFLHAGHVALMREGLARADAVAVSIFVNPTQFGPTEDLSRYPRDLEGDLATCRAAGVSAVYAPQPAAVYPPGFQTYVTVEEVARELDGQRRPGHFRGVATVVTKLLALFRPEVALFGEKDYQQLQVVRALVADLELGVEVLGVPTVREPDGLALSSRNAYLSAEERARAVALSAGLFSAQRLAEAGEGNVAVLVQAVREALQVARLREDYVEVRTAHGLQPLERLVPGEPARLLAAAFAGTTRLIDNVPLALR